MKVFRIVRSEYKDDLTGYGAFLHGGRWNTKGAYALYCASYISLAVLEIVVNYNRGITKLRPSYNLMEISIPDETILGISLTELKKSWTNDMDYTQYIGDQFLQSKSGLVLRVPSAVIPEEFNYLINPMHKEYNKVLLENSREYGMDNRLF